MKKYIYFEALTPHHALAKVHRLLRTEVTGDAIEVTVNSYTDINSEMLVWQDRHMMPFDELKGDFPGDVYTWLTSASGPFNGGTLVDELDDAESTRRRLRVAINALRDKYIFSGCQTAAGKVDTDEVSLRNIMAAHQSAVTAKVLNREFSITWRLADNTTVDLTADQMIAVGDAVTAHVTLCYEHSWTLKAQVADLQTIEALADFNINNGWPV